MTKQKNGTIQEDLVCCHWVHLTGPELAYFGEIHPFIIKKLDIRTDNVLGFEIHFRQLPET